VNIGELGGKEVAPTIGAIVYVGIESKIYG
jgi:hypothetical protein